MAKATWERMDVRGDMWGVFGCDDYSPVPRAIFGSKDDALAWIQASEANPEEPGPGFYTFALVRGCAGFLWNSHEDVPDMTAEEIERAVQRSEL